MSTPTVVPAHTAPALAPCPGLACPHQGLPAAADELARAWQSVPTVPCQGYHPGAVNQALGAGVRAVRAYENGTHPERGAGVHVRMDLGPTCWQLGYEPAAVEQVRDQTEATLRRWRARTQALVPVGPGVSSWELMDALSDLPLLLPGTPGYVAGYVDVLLRAAAVGVWEREVGEPVSVCVCQVSGYELPVATDGVRYACSSIDELRARALRTLADLVDRPLVGAAAPAAEAG